MDGLQTLSYNQTIVCILLNILFFISNKNGANSSQRATANVSNSLLLFFILSKKIRKKENKWKHCLILVWKKFEIPITFGWISLLIELGLLFTWINFIELWLSAISTALNAIYFKTIDFWGSSFSIWQRMSSSSTTFNRWLFLYFYFYKQFFNIEVDNHIV